MAHSIESQVNTAADALRERLATVERQLIQPTADVVEQLLLSLDQIEQQIAELAQSNIDLRSEEARWESIQSRLQNTPAVIVGAARRAGGFAALRAKHLPATGFWWHLDELHKTNVRKSLQRTLTTIAIILVVVVGGWQLVNFLFPPDPTAVFLLETTNKIEDRVALDDLAGALAVVDSALQSQPEAAELLIWSIVLAERLEDKERATRDLERVLQLFPDQLTQIWTMLGNQRLQMNDLDGAEAAANQALQVDDQDPQVYMLLASVAETRGAVPEAIEYFEKTYELAEDSPQLQVVARYRMGQLLQQAPMLTTSTPTP